MEILTMISVWPADHCCGLPEAQPGLIVPRAFQTCRGNCSLSRKCCFVAQLLIKGPYLNTFIWTAPHLLSRHLHLWMLDVALRLELAGTGRPLFYVVISFIGFILSWILCSRCAESVQVTGINKKMLEPLCLQMASGPGANGWDIFAFSVWAVASWPHWWRSTEAGSVQEVGEKPVSSRLLLSEAHISKAWPQGSSFKKWFEKPQHIFYLDQFQHSFKNAFDIAFLRFWSSLDEEELWLRLVFWKGFVLLEPCSCLQMMLVSDTWYLPCCDKNFPRCRAHHEWKTSAGLLYSAGKMGLMLCMYGLAPRALQAENILRGCCGVIRAAHKGGWSAPFESMVPVGCAKPKPA